MTRYLYILLIALAVLCGSSCSNRADHAESYLRRLDSLIDAPGRADMAVLGYIDSLMALQASTPAERYDREMRLHDATMSWQLDSALAHVHRARTIAADMGADTLMARADIALAFIYNTSGVMYKEAYDIFRSLPHEVMDSAMLFDYYCLGLQVHRNLAEHSLDAGLRDSYTRSRSAYRDSALMLKPDNPVLLANRYLDEGNYRRAIKVLGSDVPDGLTDRSSAVAYNVLAQIYGQQGNTAMQEKYLAQSAFCDLYNGVREYLSLQDLAMLLYADGDYDRAYRYIHRSIDDATDCNAKLRMLEMAETLPIIDSAYDAAQRRSRLGIVLLCVVIGLLWITLMIAMMYIRRKNRRLAAIGERLQASAERLAASDRIKQEYVTRFMNLCLEYLSKMESYRRELNRVASHRDFDKLYDTIRSTRYINKEIADFYDKFDEAFLNLFPTFVEDVNSLLRPGEEPRIKKGERMNTELRILALMRLGITDGESICRFLRCSPSTVYNYRTRLRNAAINRDSFEADVMAE